MHHDLVNRIQDEGGDENGPHILPALAQQLVALSRIRENGPQDGGLAAAQSLNPARIAKSMATAGWMISRKLIGPSKRPKRFSHPRLSASSTFAPFTSGHHVLAAER